MTENNNETTPPALAADDPRMAVAAAVQTARSVVDGITADQLDQPTPCGEYNVRELLNHLVVAFRRLDMVGQGQEAGTDWGPLLATDVSDDGYPAALEEAAHQIMTTWSDDSLLGKTLLLPFAELPGAFAAGLYAGEYLTHAWDLAAATNQKVDWPEEVTAGSLMGMQMGLPAEGRDDPEMPFDEVVPVPDDAPSIEKLAAWSGRDPKAWPSAVS